MNTNADALSRIYTINVVQNKTYSEYEDYIKSNIIINNNVVEKTGN